MHNPHKHGTVFLAMGTKVSRKYTFLKSTLHGRLGEKKLTELVEPTYVDKTGEPAGFKKIDKSGNHPKRRNFRRTSTGSWNQWQSR